MLHPCLDYLPKGIKKQMKGMDLEQQRKFVQDNLHSSEQDIRRALMTTKAQSRIVQFLNTTPGDQMKSTLESIFAGTGRIQRGMGSIYGRIKAVENQLHMMFRDAMEHHRPGIFGIRRDAKNERNMLREIFGMNTGDDIARGFAQQWQKITKYAKDRFNAAGGDITELLDFGVPMFHDAARISRVGFDEWFQDVKGVVRRDRLAKAVTGSTEMSDDQLELVLRKIYNRLSTDGVIKLDDLGLTNMAKKQIGKYHQEHRVLHFTDGDSWLKYFDKYGSGTPYGAMTAYMEGISRQIGAMEVLGPNHDQTLQWIKNWADDFFGDQGVTSSKLQHIYDNMMGATYGPRTKLGDTAQNLRFASVIGHLGMALPASWADAGFVGANLVEKFGGGSALKAIGQMFGRTFTLQTKDLRTLAARVGLGADYALVAARSAARISETYGHSLLARGADATIRASGLNVWTNTGKQVFGVEMVTQLTELAGRAYDQLPKPIRTFFDTYGVTSQHWDVLRRAPISDLNGVRFLDWENFRSSDQTDAVAKLIGAIVEETHIAVPEPNPRIRAMMNQGTKTGTAAGEILRTGGLFKTFPVTALSNTLARATTMTGTSRLAYLGSLVGGATVFGVLGTQAIEVLKGNDPFNWADPQLYGRGFLRGGVTGILGDFLFTGDGPYASWSNAIGGPVVGDMDMVVRQFFLGSMKDVLTLEDNFMKEIAREGITTAQRIAPGRMWYTRLAVDRAVEVFLDQLNDPSITRKRLAARRRMSQEENRGQWFEPGEMAPSRLPSMGVK